MTSDHGHFVWYELVTNDAEKARIFYCNVVGWEHQDAGMPGMNYGLFTAGGVAIGGSMQATEEMCSAGAKLGWTGYVAVDDVDATAAEFATHGGKVHVQPQDIPGVGRFAIVADPLGSVLALITEPAGAAAERLKPMARGHGSWHELLSSDPDAAFDFYAARFGWKKDQAIPMGEMGTYQIYGPAEATSDDSSSCEATDAMALGGMMKRPVDFAGPDWSYYFAVEAIEAAVDRVKANGGTVINGPMEVPGGAWIIQGLDPQGAMFSLVAPPTS